MRQVDLLLLLGERDPPPLASGRRLGRQLLADHAQRQELVALQLQDPAQPIDVLVAEQPVAAPRASGREQTLVLEVADLRDRDVGKVGLEPPADGSDRQQPLGPTRSGGRRGHQRERYVRRYLPIWSSSPSSSFADSILRRLTYVPLRLPRSSMK